MTKYQAISRAIIVLLGGLLLMSCSSHSSLRYITDLPLKELTLPSMAWQDSPMRAHAQYVLHGANSGKARKNRLGDYYFVEWYDGCPDAPTRLEMLYTQAATASRVLSRSINYDTPRLCKGIRRTTFVFNGPDRAKRGDILTWRINLYVEGKLVDTRHSYLWHENLPNLRPNQSIDD